MWGPQASHHDTTTQTLMNQYVIWTGIFLAGVILSNRVKALPVIGQYTRGAAS